MKNLIDDISYLLDNNFLDIVPLFPLSIMNIGFRHLNKIIMEERLKGMDKKVVFDYLIGNRVFIDSLSDDDIKFYYKSFKSINKIRFINKIKKILCLNK